MSLLEFLPKIFKSTLVVNGAATFKSTVTLGTTALTITGTELNKLAGVVAGTVTASKALVVDANKRLDVLVVGTLSLGASAGTAITSSAAEINQLAAQGAVTTDFAKLHAITASAAEVSTLASSGITNADLVKVHAVTATATEVNTSASVTLGTVAASKNVTVDANRDTGTLHKVTFDQEVVHAHAASQTKSATYTMTPADSGYLTYIDTDAFIITLPATAAGLSYTFVNAGADGAVLVSISPNASDKIQGVGLTAADNKDLLNTKATAKKGDLVKLVGDGVDGWLVQALNGTWAREA